MQNPDAFLEFRNLIERIYSDPYARLDSLLSRCSINNKNAIAVAADLILRKPVSSGLCSSFPTTATDLLSDSSKISNLLKRAELLEEEPEGSIRDFPEWMITEWSHDFGDEAAQRLAKILSSRAPMTIRWNRAESTDLSFADLSQTRWSPLGATRADYQSLYPNDPKNRGRFEIQDEGSQVMALFALFPSQVKQFLRMDPGEPLVPNQPFHGGRSLSSLKVVDACAGAGGKTLALAALMNGFGQVVAYDVSDKKIHALKTRARAAQFNSIKGVVLEEGQESDQIRKFYGKSDLVLVDAPCSGWGVLRRNPQIKFQSQLGDLDRLQSIQDRLLSLYAPLVKEGGRLIYGACTFRKAETLDRRDAFSGSHPEFITGQGGFFGPGPMDGFFMQEWIRKKNDHSDSSSLRT